MVYSSTYWDLYAYSTTWNKYKGYYLSLANYYDQVYDQLETKLGINVVSTTSSHKVYLLISNKTGGGFAIGCIGEIGKGPGIGVSFDAWFNPYAGSDNWSVELIAHESTNLFTGQAVGGWPVDWWADHISPFPYSVKIQVEQAAGHDSAAQQSLSTADPLTHMFLNISQEYPGVYKTMLSDLKADGWSQWFGPNPSQLLSEYVVAYLSIAAGTDLTSTVNNYYGAQGGIGYTLNDSVVSAIMSKRNSLQGTDTNSVHWQDFRQGSYG